VTRWKKFGFASALAILAWLAVICVVATIARAANDVLGALR